MVRIRRRTALGQAATGLTACWSVAAQARTSAGMSGESGVQAVVLIMLQGGLSHIDSLDPKPQAGPDVRSEFAAIQTAIPGIQLTDQLPKLARCLERIAVLRGVSHNVAIHEPGQKYVLTGVQQARGQTPGLGAIISHQLPHPAGVPAYVAVPALPPNAGELGQTHESFNALGDGGRLLTLGPDPSNAEQMAGFQRRLALSGILEKQTSGRALSPALQIRRDAYQQAQELLMSPAMRSVGDLSRETPETRERFGRSATGDYLLLTRRYLEQGAKFVAVQLDGWDTHVDGFVQLRQLLPPLDQALSGLIRDLQDRGMLRQTMVVVVSEFGRTPWMVPGGGRGHWPAAGAALLAGGRVQAGAVLGATDANGAAVVDGRCAPQDLAFTILQEMGIAPDRTFLPPTGRVLLPEGRFLQEVVAAPI